MIFRRGRFSEVIGRQLDLFELDHGDVIEEAADKLAAYNRAERDEAEEAFGEYMDAHALLAEILADMRDHYARTLDDPDAYAAEFNREVKKRMPVTATELD